MMLEHLMHHSVSTKENAHKINKVDKKAQIVVYNSRTFTPFASFQAHIDEVIMMYALENSFTTKFDS